MEANTTIGAAMIEMRVLVDGLDKLFEKYKGKTVIVVGRETRATDVWEVTAKLLKVELADAHAKVQALLELCTEQGLEDEANYIVDGKETDG